MRVFQEFTEWANYSASRLSIAEVDETEAKNAQSTAEAMAMARHTWSKGVSVTEQKAIIQSDEEVKEARERVTEVYAYRKIVKSIFENFERNAALISRELTRRTNSEPLQRRSHRGNA